MSFRFPWRNERKRNKFLKRKGKKTKKKKKRNAVFNCFKNIHEVTAASSGVIICVYLMLLWSKCYVT